MTDIDSKLRMRLAEALSAAGVGSNRVAIEVLFLLPADFVRAYEDLFHRALNTGEDGRGQREDSMTKLGRASGKESGRSAAGTVSGSKEIPAAKRAKKGGRGVFAVRDDEALGEKEQVDRQLRKLARGMRDGGNTGKGARRRLRCGEGVVNMIDGSRGGCGKWLDDEWLWCPFCGTHMTKDS